MAIALLSCLIRHERRVRLIFSNSVAAGAFTSLGYYSVTNTDGKAASPSVAGAIAIANSPNVVELQTGSDLTPGAAYSFSAVGVPALDASTTPNPSAVVGTFGQPTVKTDSIAGTSELGALVYGRDLRHDGNDFLEDHHGDLAVVAGLPNAREALVRRAESDGLPWDPTYGGRTREWVDATPGSLPTMKGRLVAQMLQDDRVDSCTASLDAADEAHPSVLVAPVLIGADGAAVEPIAVATDQGS